MKILLSLFLLLFSYGYGLCCSCIGRASIIEELNSADAVFAARILSKKIFTLEDPVHQFNMQQAEFRVKVNKVYKGRLMSDTVSVVTGLDGASCGISFTIGSEYIIYGRQRTSHFNSQKQQVSPYVETGICSRTQLRNSAEEKQIGRYYKDGKLREDAPYTVHYLDWNRSYKFGPVASYVKEASARCGSFYTLNNKQVNKLKRYALRNLKEIEGYNANAVKAMAISADNSDTLRVHNSYLYVNNTYYYMNDKVLRLLRHPHWKFGKQLSNKEKEERMRLQKEHPECY